MRYSTSELIAMGRSKEERVLREQERLWEDAGDRYVAYLDSIRAILHFRDVQLQEVEAVLPAPRNGAAAGVSFVPHGALE
jgi:hypothetical protein